MSLDGTATTTGSGIANPQLPKAGQPTPESVATNISPKTRGDSLVAYTLSELRSVTFPPRRALLGCGKDGILREGDISMIYAPRGMGKSLFGAALAIAVSSGGTLLKWQAPEPRRVLLIDGEMPSEMIRERLVMLADAMEVRECPLLTVVARDWQKEFLPRLDTPEGRALIEPLITDEVALVLLDNASTLFDPESEKDASAWQPAQDLLLSLRRRGKASALIHHANRLGGARGHSRREDIMDVILKLSRPEDYTQEQGARFRVEFDKARGFYGDSAAPFVARLDPQGWNVEANASVTTATKRLREAILAYVRAHPDSTKGGVVDNVTGREKAIRDELDLMAEQGMLQKADGKFRVA